MINPKEFIDMCKEVAKLPSGVMGMKEVPDELKVVSDGIAYYPTKRIARFDTNGNLVISGELHDLHANSVTICNLEKVERFKVRK